MKKNKTAIIRIDCYFVDALIIGKASSVGQLKFRMLEVLKEVELIDFLSVFCAKYNFEILLNNQAVDIDYVMDLDTYLVYKPQC